MADLAKLRDAVMNGDDKGAAAAANEALAAGIDPVKIVTEGVTPAMAEVGRKFECGEAFVPELLISARATKAVFQNNATQVRVQTGTVAGTITITPSFVTDAGIILTPTNPPALNLVIPASAPRVLGVEVSATTATSITLLVRGYSTARSVTKMDFQFTPTAGENVSTTSLSLPVEGNFLSWYQQAQSQQYGSLFTATIPFTLQGDVKNVTRVADTLQSVSVTLTNRQGTSAAQSVSLR